MTDLEKPQTRYAICGLGNRARKLYLPHFTGPPTAGRGQLVGASDTDPARFADLAGLNSVPRFHTDDVRVMLDQVRPDVLIVTTPDHQHRTQIEAALDAGVAVLAEKPMTVTASEAASVVEAQRRTGVPVRVAHNFRYLNLHQQIKQLLAAGAVGTPVRMVLGYRLSAGHGQSYFTRWHRQSRASGGLQVTKSCHHLDLCNWMLAQRPAEVTGWTRRAHFRASAEPAPGTIEVPADADIADTVDAVLRYPDGALAHYSLSARSTWEGYTLSVEGTAGELTTRYLVRGPDDSPPPSQHHINLHVFDQPSRRISLPREPGTHSGADAHLIAAAFGSDNGLADPAAASALDGAFAVAAGEAITRSAAEGVPVSPADLLRQSL